MEFDLLDVAKIFKETPYIVDLKPGGKYLAKDLVRNWWCAYYNESSD